MDKNHTKADISRQTVEDILKSFEIGAETESYVIQEEKLPNNTENTPLKMQYLAEVEVIKKKIGDLEAIRKNLGLSRRKMCQLLMVDPSAWTRWQKTGRVPPHIFRSLQWYMALIDKNPEWHPQNSFNRLLSKDSSNDLLVLKKQVQALKSDLEKQRKINLKVFIFYGLLAVFAVALASFL